MRPLVTPSHPSVTHVIWKGQRMTVADYCIRKALATPIADAETIAPHLYGNTKTDR